MPIPIPMVSAKKTNRIEKPNWNALRLGEDAGHIEIEGYEHQR
jgi:hypothetical protein